MSDLHLVIATQFILIVVMFIFILNLKRRMDTFDEWADTVDEFMDAEYIELHFEEKP